MKVLSITIFNHNKQNPLLLSNALNLTFFSIWQRSTIKELITFTSREILKQQQASVKGIYNFNEDYQICINLEQTGLACVIITDYEYPTHVVWSLIPKIIDGFVQRFPHWTKFTSDQNIDFPFITNLLSQMQEPANVDKISKIQVELKETEKVIKESLEKLQMRTEDLKELSQKSKDLSDMSKKFVIESEKLNSCCIIL